LYRTRIDLSIAVAELSLAKSKKKGVSFFLLSRHDQHLYPLVAQMRTPAFKRHSSTQASGKEGEYHDCRVNQGQ